MRLSNCIGGQLCSDVLFSFCCSWRLDGSPRPISSNTCRRLVSSICSYLAAIFALVVWLVGFIGALALKDVGQPTPSALMVALICGVIFAGLTLIPDVMRAINGVVRIPGEAYPLIGAVLGYAIKR